MRSFGKVEGREKRRGSLDCCNHVPASIEETCASLINSNVMHHLGSPVLDPQLVKSMSIAAAPQQTWRSTYNENTSIQDNL